jgi:hypothetical protein
LGNVLGDAASSFLFRETFMNKTLRVLGRLAVLGSCLVLTTTAMADNKPVPPTANGPNGGPQGELFEKQKALKEKIEKNRATMKADQEQMKAIRMEMKAKRQEQREKMKARRDEKRKNRPNGMGGPMGGPMGDTMPPDGAPEETPAP